MRKSWRPGQEGGLSIGQLSRLAHHSVTFRSYFKLGVQTVTVFIYRFTDPIYR